MAREIVLDVETTGLSPKQGHRIIEIACVEIDDFVPTGRHFHTYVQPERDIDPDAERVHGISTAFLEGKPRFADTAVADALTDFVGDSPLVAHNAGFDRDFVNYELTLAGRSILPDARWIDTLALAQRRFPGMHNSLDSLCKRFKVSLAEREKHGALVDARLLARIYFELQGERERSLDLAGVEKIAAVLTTRTAYGARPRPLAPRLSEQEAAAHLVFVSEIRGSIWLKSA